MVVVGKEFATVAVEEGVEVSGCRDSIWLEFGICFDDVKTVDQVEIEPLTREPHRLLLWERKRMILVEP
jgi:hypothetical protein